MMGAVFFLSASFVSFQIIRAEANVCGVKCLMSLITLSYSYCSVPQLGLP